MSEIYYLIRTPTLRAIICAISQVGSAKPFPKISICESAPIHLIRRDTLVKIADIIRAGQGSTDEILVTELSDKILGFLSTPAILGKAILGKTILGDYLSGLPKLDAPNIRLEVAEDLVKLDAPVIYLETEEDGGEDEPVIVKLAAPEIFLEVVEEIKKLDTPIIHFEVIEDDQPDEPAPIIKLDAPVIQLKEETVVFDADVTTAYEQFGSGVSFTNAVVLSNEVLLDRAISSYTVKIDGVEYICTLYGNSGLWMNGDTFDSTIALYPCDGQGTAIVAPIHLGEDGEVHHIRISYKDEDVKSNKLNKPIIYIE